MFILPNWLCALIFLVAIVILYGIIIYFAKRGIKEQIKHDADTEKQNNYFDRIRIAIHQSKNMEELYLCLNAILEYNKTYNNIQDLQSLEFMYQSKERRLLKRNKFAIIMN